MSKEDPFLSIIVPLYNESDRLDSLSAIVQYLENQPFTSQLIVVNDGSTDDTLAKLRIASPRPNWHVVGYDQNRGKGYAVRRGMLVAKGKYRLFTDIDLSTPLAELSKFLPHLENYDIVIGSRRKRGARLLRRQSKIRETLGHGFTLLSRLMLQLTISDVTCGFKCFSESAASNIFPRLTIDRWGFDSEIFYIAKKRGLSVKEIPVVWKNDPKTKVRFPHDLLNSLMDLIRIRFNDVKKIYD